MKIKPLEKKENQLIKIKLALLSSLIISALIFSFFIKKPIKNNPSKKENVLGVEESLPDVNQISKEILNETTNYINQITSNVTDATSNVASQAGNTISSLIYDTAVKPIIDQIQRLPKDQQEKVKEQICK
jgi:hypothetical protein